jgi:hypothetical protein
VRKPLGSPMAKSKMFRIAPKKFIPADEKAEVKRLYDNYFHQMKSLRQLFKLRFLTWILNLIFTSL